MIREWRAGDEAAWDDFVARQAGARSCHLLAWKRVVEHAFGREACYLLSEDAGGQIDGVLPVVRLRSWLFGDYLVSVPYLNYGGPCSGNSGVARQLIDAAARTAARLGVQHLEVRTETPTDLGLKVRSTKVSMRLPLPESADALSKRFPAKLRSQIRRSELELPIVTIGRDAAHVSAFYEVFAENMRDLGTPVYAKRFFETILRELPGSSWICSVHLGRQPVAAGFLVGFQDMLEIPWASSLRRFNRFSPNMLLYWNVLKFACERGYKVFDFGRSSPDSGTFRFKAQWGAEPVPLYWHYWTPEGRPLPDLSPKNPRMRLAIRAWQHLPVAVTKIIGPPIVKGLP
ncbi:MAG TPA: FemAB family XrtA/PEP-CTERM system-associated protein [Vicinamibacterales bacterium]|jgi:FemAB-related protein (PEP-CTERM system-associated)